MRLAHATDIHWCSLPPPSSLLGKRLLGSANLYLAGRRRHFDEAVQSALVDHLVDLEVDAVAITGDLTAQALPSEFAKAREALAPILAQTPVFIIPGNHDAYTRGAVQDRRFEEFLGPWMGRDIGGGLRRLDVGEVTLLGLDPNRPTFIKASGVIPRQQLDALEVALHSDELRDRTVVLTLHYPLVNRHGALYDGAKHGLLNASELVQVLATASVRPVMALHGHVHHGYQGRVALPRGTFATFNCGSSGYAYLPKQDRAAAMAVYTLEHGDLVRVERYIYDGARFALQAGGAFAAGWPAHGG